MRNKTSRLWENNTQKRVYLSSYNTLGAIAHSHSNSIYLLTHTLCTLASVWQYALTQIVKRELLTANCDYSYSPIPSVLEAICVYSSVSQQHITTCIVHCSEIPIGISVASEQKVSLYLLT